MRPVSWRLCHFGKEYLSDTKRQALPQERSESKKRLICQCLLPSEKMEERIITILAQPGSNAPKGFTKNDNKSSLA